MKILAVDDERIALKGLEDSILKVVPQGEIQCFRNPLEALEASRKTKFDIAFLDIEMRRLNGIELAKQLKAIYPRINIIFTTGYMEYTEEALELRVSGYVSKPITPEKLKRELEELRYPVESTENRLRVKTFGNFEVYTERGPLRFQNSKTKELMAYLVDRNGSLCTKQEIISVLWEDETDGLCHNSYMNKIRADLIRTLKEEGYEDVLIAKRGILGIRPEKIDCDYFAYLQGATEGIRAYRGEYMTQYSWAEMTHGTLEGIL